MGDLSLFFTKALQGDFESPNYVFFGRSFSAFLENAQTLSS